ncbi:MAG TPA: helix-turn-helix domain-containing protein [Micromonosporaceae bacterium]
MNQRPTDTVIDVGDISFSRTYDTSETSTDNLVTAAYALLLREPGLDILQFAARLKCSVESARHILDRLADMALLKYQQNEYGSWVAVSPIVALQQLIARERKLLEQRELFLKESLSSFSAILKRYALRSADESEDLWLGEEIVGLPSVRRRLEELASQAQKEVISFSPSAFNPAATRAASRPLDLAGLHRGVRMRTIHCEQLAMEEAALDFAWELVEAGAEIRLVPELPMRFIVVDGEVAVIPRLPGKDSEGALVVRHASILTALTALFEAYWQTARPLSHANPDTRDCTPVEQSVLRLLATGAKDDAIARALGTSVRTVRRVIAELSERTEAASRFALGMYAAKRGWI